MAASTCGHATCRCTRPYDARTLALSSTPTDPDAEFCHPRCAAMAQRDVPSDDGCECGHPNCTPQATADIPPMQ